MKWYEDLYVGDSIEGKVNRIKWKINHHAGTVSIYVIAFASNRKNLLDIIPAWELMQKSYPGKKQMQIIGLAKGYAEALELVRSIIGSISEYRGCGCKILFTGPETEETGMSVFLLILKIIGIALLVILGLIVVIALLALFCPFVYRVKGSYHEKNLQLQVRIWWLGRLLGLCADTAEEGFHTYVRIFGFRKELHLQKEKEDSADFKKPVQEDSPQEGIKDRETEVAPSLTAMENTSQTSAQQLTDPEETILCHPDKKKKTFFPGRIAGFIRKFPEKIRNILQKILYFLRNIQTFWKKGTRTCRKWYLFFNDEKNKKAFSNIWKQLEHLVVSVLPKRLKLWLKYSTGSPDTTGQVLGILAIFPVGYRNHWNIIPDFTAEEFYAEADFTVHGRIFGVQILALALRIILDKNCRRLYNRFKHMK